MSGEVSEETARRIAEAVMLPGRVPQAHERQLRRMAMEWPELARGLARLCDEVVGVRPQAWRGLQK